MRRYKALSIGISYRKPSAAQASTSANAPHWEQLEGPLLDVKAMKSVLKNRLRYKEVVVITDKKDPLQVSRRNILAKLRWLVDGAKSGDILFLHYSGHGWQRPTRRNTEVDGLDEAIVPADCPYPKDDNGSPQCALDCPCEPEDPKCWRRSYRGMIRDNELRKILVEDLPTGVHLVTLFDACHSASILDLQYQYLPRGAVFPRCTPKGLTMISPEQRLISTPPEVKEGPLEKLRKLVPKREPRPCALGQLACASTLQLAIDTGIPDASLRMVDDHLHEMRSNTGGVAISLSACIDQDLAFEMGDARGVLTTNFIKLMEDHNYHIKTDVLLDEMYPLFFAEWQSKWKDALDRPIYPVLCSNRLVDLSSPFLI